MSTCQWTLCEWQHKGIPDCIYIHSGPHTHIKITVCCIDAVCFNIWRLITHSVFPTISEDTDRDILNAPHGGKVLTSVHQSLFTCFIRQGHVKTNFDVSLYCNRHDSLASVFSFCSVSSSDDIKKMHSVCLWLSILLACLYLSRHPCCCMHTFTHLCLYSVSKAELRWATACCSAVTKPALVCIIYPPADWFSERHNHSNQSHACTSCEEKHRL